MGVSHEPAGRARTVNAPPMDRQSPDQRTFVSEEQGRQRNRLIFDGCNARGLRRKGNGGKRSCNRLLRTRGYLPREVSDPFKINGLSHFLQPTVHSPAKRWTRGFLPEMFLPLRKPKRKQKTFVFTFLSRLKHKRFSTGRNTRCFLSETQGLCRACARSCEEIAKGFSTRNTREFLSETQGVFYPKHEVAYSCTRSDEEKPPCC